MEVEYDPLCITGAFWDVVVGTYVDAFVLVTDVYAEEFVTGVYVEVPCV